MARFDPTRTVKSTAASTRTSPNPSNDTDEGAADQKKRERFRSWCRACDQNVGIVQRRHDLMRTVAVPDSAGIRTAFFVLPVTPDGKYYAYSYERLLSDLYLVEGLK